MARLARQTNGLWMSQVARNLTDVTEGFLVGKRYLNHDRDPFFTAEFLEARETIAMQWVKEPLSLDLIAHAGRASRTIKESCLGRINPFGEDSLWTAVHDFVEHDHPERNRQGLDNRLIMEEESRAFRARAVQCRQPLG